MAKKTVKLHRRGNPISQNPLMKKGGVHEKSRSAKRQQAKRDLRKQIPFFMGLCYSANYVIQLTMLEVWLFSLALRPLAAQVKSSDSKLWKPICHTVQ